MAGRPDGGSGPVDQQYKLPSETSTKCRSNGVRLRNRVGSPVIRDLRVLSQPLGGRVLHYRDNKGLEVDAVVVCDDGRWGAFEVKLGSGRIDDAAKNLLAFAKKVDTAVCGEPGVLAVVTGTGLAYRRKDGVHVVPIGTLGP